MTSKFTTIAHAYRSLVSSGKVKPDKAQENVAGKLDDLAAKLQAERKRRVFRKKPEAIRGLYIYGEVGRGKSMLMDLFFEHVVLEKKRRVHFHAFMLEVHQRLLYWRKANPNGDDPLPAIAASIARESSLLCFDEFQVTDIADAMILGRLFEALFREGVTVVATSNRHPQDLYKNGLQRDRFLPFIALLQDRVEVLELAGEKDYRLEHLQSLETVYFPMLGEKADAFIAQSFRIMTDEAALHPVSISVEGRMLEVPRHAAGVAWFTFNELCAKPLGAADYIEIAREFHTVLMQDIPVLTPDKRNEAKRFVTFIDELYEHRTKFICTAEVVPELLYPSGDGSFEFQRTVSRLMEMQSVRYLGGEHVA